MNNPQAEFQQAFALHQRGELDSAEKIYRSILASQPRLFEVAHALGIVLLQRGDYRKAEQQLARAIKLNPRDTSAHNNRGNALMELGRVDEAIASYGEAIAAEPMNAGAYYNRGSALGRVKRFDEAIKDIDKALALSPPNPQVLANRGNILAENNRLDDALASFDKAIAIDPRYAPAWVNRATALIRLRRLNDAETSARRAIEIEPNALAYNALGTALAALKKHDLAIAAFGKALALDPLIDGTRSEYLMNKLSICDWSELADDVRRVIADVENDVTGQETFVLLSIPSSPEQQLQCSQQYIRRSVPPRAVPARAKRSSHSRIRVGYVSSDLRDHPVGYLSVGLFEEHDKSRFEIVGISTRDSQPNEISERISAACTAFHDVSKMSDAETAGLIQKSGIDVLVDLNGHTAGHRTGIFAFRPAPIQVNYLGFAGTMGAPYLDYIIADRRIVSEKEERFYTEKVVCLPGTFQPNDRKRKISDRPVSRENENLPERAFVFCCFNNCYKILPQVFDVWMRLLKEVEGSVLWITAPNSFARENLKREAERRGVSPERIVFAEYTKLLEDHLARCRLADIFLDTLPYNAHTTASDALWTGLPLLTCRGETYASRVSSSLLHAAGLPELVTHSLEEYEALALKLARDPALLASFRERLAKNRDTYPLFDTGRYTRNLESAYEAMLARHDKGQSAKSFVVSEAGSQG